jgi:hypothetical protein
VCLSAETVIARPRTARSNHFRTPANLHWHCISQPSPLHAARKIHHQSIATTKSCCTPLRSTNSTGFQSRTPTFPQQDKLRSLTAGQISQIQAYGLTLYVYPDWPNRRVLVGGPQQYQAYQQYRLSRHLPAENPPPLYRGPASSFDWRKWYSGGG